VKDEELDLVMDRAKICYQFIMRSFPFRRPTGRFNNFLFLFGSDFKVIRWYFGGTWAKFSEDGFWHWVHPERLKILKTQPLSIERYDDYEKVIDN